MLSLRNKKILFINALLHVFIAREPLYSNSAAIKCWLQSTSAQNNAPILVVKKRNNLGQYFTSANILRLIVSLINPAVCIGLTKYM